MSGSPPSVSSSLEPVLRNGVHFLLAELRSFAIALQHYHLPSLIFGSWLVCWWTMQAWRSRRLHGKAKLHFIAVKMGEVVWSHVFQLLTKAGSAVLLAYGVANTGHTMLLAGVCEMCSIILLLPLPAPELPYLRNRRNAAAFSSSEPFESIKVTRPLR